MGDCFKCGDCCKAYTIPVKDDIHKRQIEFLEARGYELQETELGLFLRMNARCPHLTKKNLCDIYEQRPEICKRHHCC